MPSAMTLDDASPFRVREYTPSDFPHLCTIDRLCFPEGIAYTPEEIALGLAQPGAFALVAVLREGVIGFVLADQKRRSLGHIITIDVRPEFRSQGVGNQLMPLTERRLQQRGALRVVLEVAVQNESAIRFYKKRGYAIRRLLPSYYRDGSDAYLMGKTLS